MSQFTVGQEPPRIPAGMKIVGVGVILSCLFLSFLFGWGIYLNLGEKSGECVGSAEARLLRNSDPEFTFEIPPYMQDRPKSAGQLYSGGQMANPFSLQVSVSDLGKDGFDAWVKTAGEGWVKSFKDMGSKVVDILRVEPTSLYKGYRAVEMEIRWEWTDGTTRLTNINHYILKGNKVISLSSTLIGDKELAYDMFDEIDLNPEKTEKSKIKLDLSKQQAQDEDEDEDSKKDLYE